MKLGDKVSVTSCFRFSFFRSPCSTRESNLLFFAPLRALKNSPKK